MEEATPRTVNARERGAALILALVALAILLPLAIVLSNLVLIRKRQVTAFREDMAGQVAVRNALDLAMLRLRTGEIDPAEEEETTFATQTTDEVTDEAEAIGLRPVDVRVSRQPDVILTLDGEVLPAPPHKEQPPPAPIPPQSLAAAAPGSGPPDFAVHSEDPLAPDAPASDVAPPHRRLGVYVVEAMTQERFHVPDVRLTAVVVRTDEGRVTCVGQRYDRGYFRAAAAAEASNR